MGDGNAPGAADSVEGDLERSSALSGSGMVIAGDQFVLFSGRVQHFQMEHLCTGGAGSFKGDFDLSAPDSVMAGNPVAYPELKELIEE